MQTFHEHYSTEAFAAFDMYTDGDATKSKDMAYIIFQLPPTSPQHEAPAGEAGASTTSATLQTCS
jgi:S-adenosylmethionine/arginine decarboxylase-like enzyme